MILSVLVFLFSFSNQVLMFDQYRKVAEKNILESLGKGQLSEIEISSQREYYSFDSDSGSQGTIVVFSSAKGRYENFDYMIIINSSFEIIYIKVLKYRSDYGYEISNKRWLKQFCIKPSIHFEYRKNIDGLSGATFSALSLVNDVNSIIDYLKKELVISSK
jgi:Na+-translocating ferredoxin:NAD+ oxidoreductase RnfG subunit